MTERIRLSLYLSLIIGAGVLSRLLHTGSIVLDKYLGDALYAAMVYVLLRLFFPRLASPRALVLAGVVMLMLELFQLTMLPATMQRSGNSALRLLAIVLGTTFSLWDLLAYALGLAGIYALDRQHRQARKPPPAANQR